MSDYNRMKLHLIVVWKFEITHSFSSKIEYQESIYHIAIKITTILSDLENTIREETWNIVYISKFE